MNTGAPEEFRGSGEHESREPSSGHRPRVVRFAYPVADKEAPEPVWPLPREEEPDQVAELRAEIDSLEREHDELTGQLRTRIATAREEAAQAARQGLEQRQVEALDRIHASLVRALNEFESARGRYFAAIEREVVELALAIAARILHRETQMDPLLLRGAVRVALNRLAESSEVQLVVPAGDTGLWEETLRSTVNLPVHPVVAGDEHMRPGECRLVATVGTVDLGVRAQLEEIERGFFDLLGQREAVSTPRRMGDSALA